MRIWDLIVVGAGPAGTAAARVAARAGLRTLLLEAEEFPRPKPCGGGVTAAALTELAVPLPLEVAGKPTHAIRARLGDLAVTVRRESLLVRVVRRDRFDGYLLALARGAGAEVRTGARVEAVEQDGSRVVVYGREGERWEGRLVVGADGARSRVAAAVRPPYARRDLGVCQVAEFPGPPEARDRFLADGLEVWYGSPDRGYGWIFPLESGLNVGVGSVARRFPNLRGELSGFLSAAGLPEPTRVTGAVLPLAGRERPAQVGRVMLAGDALGVADPFTGEGIRYALLSGRLAAECAAAALSRSVRDPDLSAYPELCREAFGADLRCAAWLARVYLALPLAVNALVFRHPGLFAGLTDILAGRSTYRELVGALGQNLPGYWLKGLLSRPTLLSGDRSRRETIPGDRR